MLAKNRKMKIALILFLTCTTALTIKYCTFQEWASFMQWIAGIYIVGNIGEHYTSKMPQK